MTGDSRVYSNVYVPYPIDKLDSDTFLSKIQPLIHTTAREANQLFNNHSEVIINLMHA
jgi:hypothetical protein